MTGAAEPGGFGALSGEWWAPGGSLRFLHQVNPLRLRHAQAQVGPLAGLRVADVGCGGGIFSEALARAGAEVVGIDPCAEAIAAARAHARESGLDIDYRVSDAGRLAAEERGGFDAVTCLEVLEHAGDPRAEVARIAGLARPSGRVLFSTINRTLRAYLLMVVAVEEALGILPRGTHSHQAFIRPGELAGWCREAGLRVTDVTGMRYSLFGKLYLLDPRDTSVNYFLTAARA